MKILISGASGVEEELSGADGAKVINAVIKLELTTSGDFGKFLNPDNSIKIKEFWEAVHLSFPTEFEIAKP